MDSEQRDDEIATFRHFNRLYTRTIGTLSEGLLDSQYSLTEARVLYELDTRKEAAAKEIAAALNLDAGYLSRILRKFEEAGLIEKETSAADARQTLLKLTHRGKAAFGELNQLSNKQARELLDRLAPSKRDGLLRSMKTIEEALTSETSAPYSLRPHRPGDMGWVTSRHGALYAEEYGWDISFEALVAEITAAFVNNFDAGRERCWIAEIGGEPVGSIFAVADTAEAAKLRLLLVEPSARGLGIGRRLVGECIAFARQTGYH